MEPYTATHPEMVVVLGSYAFAGLVFLALLKVFPVIGMPVGDHAAQAPSYRSRSTFRRNLMLLTLAAGVFLIAWGILTRDYDLAPVKWLMGLTLLVLIPLESCLLRDRLLPEPAGAQAGETSPDRSVESGGGE
jgi:hypothetical protein